MEQRQIDIAYMQCRVLNMAQTKWNITPSECADIFKKSDLLGFISECYELLHVSSCKCALDDIEQILLANGIDINRQKDRYPVT